MVGGFIQTFTLPALGAICVLYTTTRLCSFIWLYYLRPPSLHKFLHGKQPYALVTGASDGIGRAVAQELYQRGFNLILHGRNEAKLKGVIDEIHAQAGTKERKREIEYFVVSAEGTKVDFEKIVNRFKDLHITLFINNVGAGRPRFARIDGISEQTLLEDIQVNALFSFNITRAFLSKLRAARAPVEVIFLGSVSADLAIPRLATYSASKSFLYQTTRCLNTDERYGPPSQVRFAYWNVGSVITNSNVEDKPSFFFPRADQFAKHAMGIIGCGKEKVIPYAPHAIQQCILGLLPQFVVDNLAVANIQRIIEHTEKRAE